MIKVKLDLENAQEHIKHLNTQVRNKAVSLTCLVHSVLKWWKLFDDLF